MPLNFTHTCLNCGQPLFHDEDSSYMLHQFHRWPNDNGYLCYQGGTLAANHHSREEQDFIDEGWASWYKDGRHHLLNTKTKEVIDAPWPF